jgi:hypothetical protein
MLIKSFVTVTVAVTTSYGNKNWELKLSREGNDTDSKLWNQDSGTIQSQQRAKGVEQGCLQMRLHSAMKVL